MAALFGWCATAALIIPDYSKSERQVVERCGPRLPATWPRRPASQDQEQPSKTKSAPKADDPPTPGSNDPLLAELRETTTQRLAALLASIQTMATSAGSIKWRGHGHGLWPGAEAGPGLARWCRRRRRRLSTSRVQSVRGRPHTSVIVDGAAAALGLSPRRRLAGRPPSQLPGSVRPGTSPWRADGASRSSSTRSASRAPAGGRPGWRRGLH